MSKSKYMAKIYPTQDKYINQKAARIVSGEREVFDQIEIDWGLYTFNELCDIMGYLSATLPDIGYDVSDNCIFVYYKKREAMRIINMPIGFDDIDE